MGTDFSMCKTAMDRLNGVQHLSHNLCLCRVKNSHKYITVLLKCLCFGLPAKPKGLWDRISMLGKLKIGCEIDTV